MGAQDNQHLTDAIAVLQGASVDRLEVALRALLQAIVDSTLIRPKDNDDKVLLLFASKLDLHFFEPGCPSTEVRGADAIRSVAEGKFDGLVLNPGTREFELSREDVLDYFEVDDL